MSRILFYIAIAALGYSNAGRAAHCGGALTDHHRAGFVTFFASTYSPSLVNVGRNSAMNVEMVKRLSQSRLQTLRASPIVAASTVLSEKQAEHLRGWLTERATSEVPSWVAAGVGIFSPVTGIAVDVAGQYINAAGADQRLSAASTAGRVMAGGRVGVLEAVQEVEGELRFLYNLVHSVTIDGRNVQSVLAACSAPVVVSDG